MFAAKTVLLYLSTLENATVLKALYKCPGLLLLLLCSSMFFSFSDNEDMHAVYYGRCSKILVTDSFQT